jgi:hypothetical protein
MSHVSSLSNSSYALRGTLSRLDTNGDGVLSREEIAAGQRPGIFGESTNNDITDSSQSVLGNIIAVMMQSVPASGARASNAPATLPGTSNGVAVDADLQVAMDAYRGTYGQYDSNDQTT